jgi:2-succinyl-5-enolpyruvyl-6-hydroxy-3-cyclohexene-1-carboxylate synthase
MNTTKKSAQIIAKVCHKQGIRKVVFSPGSRSAPLVIAFSNIPEIECIVIPDERVAGYFALGMAQQLRETVAVVCTSGTAVLNLAPAVCEAFHQFVPLLVITADRPAYKHGAGENQTINQIGIFENYVAYSLNISNELDDEVTIANEVETCINNSFIDGFQPVHLNVEFDEPLYELTEDVLEVQIKNKTVQSVIEPLSISEAMYGNTRLMIAGMHHHDSPLNTWLKQAATRTDTVVIAEPLSNSFDDNFVYHPDLVLSAANKDSMQQYSPEVLVTTGKHFLSKRLRQFLQKHPPLYHFHLHEGNTGWNFLKLAGNRYFETDMNDEVFRSGLLKGNENSDFSNKWLNAFKQQQPIADFFLEQIPFCDISVFNVLINSFPADANVQYGNSTPIRYSSFFKHSDTLSINANRGTSGIDGCLSTAAGAAYVRNELTICVLGDVSFLYDSNALWNNYLSPNLRIIVINNSGGNIFKLIEGPSRVADFEKFFQTKHTHSMEHLASMYDLPYYICASETELTETLKTFYQTSARPKLLEIKTDGELSADVYKKYFEKFSQPK